MVTERYCSGCHTPLLPNRIRCTSCGKYNHNTTDGKTGTESTSAKVVLLSEVKSSEEDRLDCDEWNRIFGGKILNPDEVAKGEPEINAPGLVRDSTILLGGKQGSGKSTGLLHLLDILLKKGIELKLDKKAMYIATEESDKQIKGRADRINIELQDYIYIVNAMTGDIDIPSILMTYKPCIVILDSINGLVNEDVTQGTEVCKICKQFAVTLNCPFIITAHVTKGDEISGLNTWQHTVDTVMIMSPDDEDPDLRVLAVDPKNRFGRAFIEMWFEMTDEGLFPIEDPNEES